ncbi:MAG: HEAT repeat domain-containing protein [Planctomycetota bacterium]|nr:HEAT repeat domain-containing protein [Planctomycetota bacterium]
MGIFWVAVCVGLQGGAQDSLLLEEDPDLRVRGIRLLAKEGTVRAARKLMALHDDPHPRVRRMLARGLGRIRNLEVRAWLVERGLGHPRATARRLAARAFGEAEDLTAADGLIDRVRDRDASVRESAVWALGRIRAQEASDEVARALRGDRSWKVRAAAADALARMLRHHAAPKIQAALMDDDPRVRLAALEALEQIAPGDARREAIGALEDPEWIVRCTGTEVLARLGTKEAVGPLIERLILASGREVRDLWKALQAITGRDLGADPEAWKIWWEANGPSWEPRQGTPRPGREESTRERVTYYQIPIWSDRVVFVMDLSESMNQKIGGVARVDRAREELGRALAALPRSCRYNLIRFRSEPEALSPQLLRPSAANRIATLRWLGAPGGGTNIYDALDLAIRAGQGDTIFLLTDGAPSRGTYKNKGEILESIREINRFRKVRIHTIGISSHAVSTRWKGLLEGLASGTGGECVTRN